MAPPKKVRKVEEETEKPPDDTFQLNIVPSKITGVTSFYPTRTVRGVSWSVGVKKSVFNGKTYLAAYLYCKMNNESKLWSIDARQSRVLVHPSDPNSNIKSDISAQTFDCDYGSWGNNVVDWEVLTDEQKGYVKDDKVTLLVKFWIVGTRGFREAPEFDFSNSDPLFDITLLIAGQKIYVGKQFLATLSPVLKATFYGPFTERNKKEVELNEVDPKEFIDMLNVMYQSAQPITDTTVIHILKLADRFQVKVALDAAEEYLLTLSALSNEQKLLLSDKYRLVKLQDSCLKKLTTPQLVKKLIATPEYKLLSDPITRTLLERICRLTKDDLPTIPINLT